MCEDDLKFFGFRSLEVDKGGNTCPIFGVERYALRGINLRFLPSWELLPYLGNCPGRCPTYHRLCHDGTERVRRQGTNV